MRIRKLLSKATGFLILSVICLSITGGLVFLSEGMTRPPLKGLEHQIVDLAFQVRKHNPSLASPSTEDIVIIDIDDASILELGRPQLWPRSYDADVITYVSGGKPKAIGIDYLYTEYDELPEIYALQLEKSGFRNARSIIASLRSDDQLAEAIFHSRSTYLSIFDDDARGDEMMDTLALDHLRMIAGNNDSVFWPPLLHHPVLPVPEFSATAKGVGTIAMPTMQDGTVRNYHLLHEVPLYFDQPMYIANFPLYIFLDVKKIKEEELTISGSDLQLPGNRVIPLHEDGSFRINWTGSEDKIRYISFYKVMQGLIPQEYFADKYVFFGTSASGMQDLKTVPSTEGKMPGVEVHAIAFLNLMNGAFIHEVGEMDMLLILYICSLILTFVFLSLKPIIGFLTSLALVFGEMFLFVLWLMPEYQVIFPIVSLMLLTLLSYVLSSLYIYFVREKRSRRLKYAFGTYVSPDVVEQISKDPSVLQLGGEKKELTVLFTDIRGFTSYSEELDPQEIVTMLNDYLSRMSEVILRFKGTIDKFIGDAIMAIFGAPIFQKDHPVRACSVALEMMEELKKFNELRLEKGDRPLEIGIGINTGEMTVGNIGSHRRFDYTVIGDAVNLASRLESLTKQFGVNVIISENTMQACPARTFLFRELPSVVVKGKEKPVKIYELLDHFSAREKYGEYTDLWESALEAMRARHFSLAIDQINACLKWRKNDPAALHFLHICHESLDNPEAFTMTMKMESK